MAVGAGKDAILMWVRDDGVNLSVALEVLADNTIDESDDKTVLYVRGKDDMRTFSSDSKGGKYSRMGSGYSGESEAEHRIYEFVIPFSMLPSPDEKGKLGIAFAVTM